MSSTKTIKGGISKANLNAIIAALGTATLNKLIPIFSTSVAYTKGQYTNYNNYLYRFTADKSAGAWDNTKVEAKSLNDLISELNDFDLVKLSKGDYDGTTGVGYADLANELETKITVPEQNPFSFQTTAVGEEVASVAKLNALVGVDVVKNEAVDKPSIASWPDNGAVTGKSFSGGVVSFTATSQYGRLEQNKAISIVKDHKYLIHVSAKASSNLVGYFIGNYLYKYFQGTDSWEDIWEIQTASNNEASAKPTIMDTRSSDFTEVQFKDDIITIDLTQRYGSNDVVNAIIGNDSSKQVANLLKFDPNILKDLSYDAGTLVPAKSAKLKNVGFNQWDEETVVDGGFLYGKNAIKVIPNGDYYFKCPTTNDCYIYVYEYDVNNNLLDTWGIANNHKKVSINCDHIAIRLTNYPSGTTYNHDICISIHWDSTRDGEYEPYEANVYDLPNKALHGILKVVDGKVVADGDELYHDGTGKTKTAIIQDLSQLDWQQHSDPNTRYVDIDPLHPEEIINFDKIARTTNGYAIGYSEFSTYGRLYINVGTSDSSVNPTGALLYLLDDAHQTDLTNQGTYDQNVIVDNWGTMQFLDENDTEIAGLQGLYVDYRSALKDFLEAMASRAQNAGNDGAEEFVTQPELATKQDAMQNLSSSGLTAESGITLRFPRLQKLGNVVFIDFVIQNTSGSTISANAKVLTIDSTCAPSSTSYGVFNGENQAFEIKTNGDIRTLTEISAGAYVEYHGCFQK